MASIDEYRERVDSVLTSLQISSDLLASRALPLCQEAETLVIAELGPDGREHHLVPAAADAWRAMRAAARAAGLEIRIVSAFRGLDRQAEIVRRKLARGLSLYEILSVSAPPGYSEHHTGRAVDVAMDGAAPLELEFGQTPAFRWLSENANSFSFFLSFPSGNPYGYVYEPWHWCFRSDVA
jgi:D-alanyl-D-alanine carboxypeptidase